MPGSPRGRRRRWRGIRSGRIALDYVATLIEDFAPWPATASYGEDEAIVGGLGRFRGDGVASSARKKATTPTAGSSTISAWRGRKAIARRPG